MAVNWQVSNEGGYEIKSAFGTFYLSTRYLDNSYDYVYDACFYANGDVGSIPSLSLCETFQAENDYQAKESALEIFRKWVEEWQCVLRANS